MKTRLISLPWEPIDNRITVPRAFRVLFTAEDVKKTKTKHKTAQNTNSHFRHTLRKTLDRSCAGTVSGCTSSLYIPLLLQRLCEERLSLSRGGTYYNNGAVSHIVSCDILLHINNANPTNPIPTTLGEPKSHRSKAAQQKQRNIKI